MNREQMIAWLTLEGWEPRADHRDIISLVKGEDRVSESATLYRHSLYVRDFKGVVEWDRITNEMMDVLCK